MGKSKDYKAGGAKKWLIILGILVLIAVVIVAVVLLIPANTYSMIEALQENEEHFFLTDEKEHSDFDEFTLKITSNASLSYYTEEINNVEVISQGMASVLSYYNDYFVFAKKNKTLSSNTKTINKYITTTNKVQKNIDNLLENTKKLNNDSVSYLKNSWIDFRKEFNKYIEAYYKMFASLSKCYKNCFDTSYSKNAASMRILDTANDYIYCIMSDYKIISNNDKKDRIEQGNYAYSSTPKITWFKAFVDKCVVNTNEISRYLYSEDLQLSYAKVDNFFKVYKQNDFKNMINAIYVTGLTNPYNSVEDNDGLFENAKTFLDRRG